MKDSSANDKIAELKAWYRPLLDSVVKEMLRTKAVTGIAVEASPVWVLPHRVLIAKVWDASQKSQFIWAIAGDDVIMDHIAGSMAKTPKDVARHFALKWQMDADQLVFLAKTRAADRQAEAHMKPYADKLVKCAEFLYELTEHDDVWKVGLAKG